MSKPKKLKPPVFKNEDEERDFWSTIDLSEYFSQADFTAVSFPNLKQDIARGVTDDN